MGLHGSAAASAAVADGIEALQHSVLEEGMMDVTALVLGAENLHRLIRRNPARALGVMLGDEAGERFAYNKAHVKWFARIGANDPARAVEHDDVIWILEHDVTGSSIGNHLLQVPEADLLVHRDQLNYLIQRYGLTVVRIGKCCPFVNRLVASLGAEEPEQPAGDGTQDASQAMLAGRHADVQIGPAGVHVAVHAVKPREPWTALRLLQKGLRRRP
jgi:hypothetical protein